jgi:asparaginyl-tRNA synthetase
MTEALSKAAAALGLADSTSCIFSLNVTHLALEKVYVDEANGVDETGKGTQAAPYKTPLHAALQSGGLDKVFLLIKKEGSDEYAEIAKSASKKLQKTIDGIRKKEAKAASVAATSVASKEVEEDEKIEEDPSLPRAEKIKIRQATEKRGIRVCVRGWVATARVQSRKLVFLDLRDGSDLHLQCVLTGKLVCRISRHAHLRLKVELSER